MAFAGGDERRLRRLCGDKEMGNPSIRWLKRVVWSGILVAPELHQISRGGVLWVGRGREGGRVGEGGMDPGCTSICQDPIPSLFTGPSPFLSLGLYQRYICCRSKETNRPSGDLQRSKG